MKYSSFEQIAQVCRGKEGLKRVAVAGAADQHVLQAVIEAHKEGIAEPVLVGDPERIAEELKGEAEFEIAKEGVSYDALLIIRGCTQCPYLYETIDAKERVICTSQEEIPDAVRQIRDKL